MIASGTSNYGSGSIQGSQHESSTDSFGYPSSGPAVSRRISSSTLPAASPIGEAIGIPYSRASFSESRVGQSATSYNGGGGGGGFGSDSLSGGSSGGGGYDPLTGWRSSTGITSRHSSWEDPERLGRQRDRLEEQYRPWGDREGEGTGTAGIGLSNMSPFSRDGGRTLVETPPEVGGTGYRARQYSLGPVGSGRMRGDTNWGSSRPLREAEDEEDDDAFAPPTRSGATSRRHSFAAFHPITRSTGFRVADDVNRSNEKTSRDNSNSTEFGIPTSAINDDDLSADLNSLHLNLEAHVAATESNSRRLSSSDIESTHFPSPSTLKTPSGYLGDSSNLSYATPIAAPSTGGYGDASLFKQARSIQSTQSRFEFGNFIPAPAHAQGEFSLGGRGYPSQLPPQQPPRYAGAGFGPSSTLATTISQPFFPSPPPPNHNFSAQAPAFGHVNPFYASNPSISTTPSSNFSPSTYTPTSGAPSSNAPSSPDVATTTLGKGVPLHAVPANAPLYIVEFKAGRKDLFFCEDPALFPRPGDLVIVEADRGRDVGKLLKPCSLDEVQAFQQRLVEVALGQLANPNGGAVAPTPSSIAKMTKEFAPKKIFGKAQAADTQMLLSKAQDEVKVLAMVRSKVQQKSKFGLFFLSRFRWLLTLLAALPFLRSPYGSLRCRVAVGS